MDNNFRYAGEPPNYEGLDPALWTAEIHHGGQLQDIGNGYNFYFGGSVVWVDNLNRDYMSPFDFDWYKFKINDWYKVKAVCKAEPCPWSVYASSNDLSDRHSPLHVKTLVLNHTCGTDENNTSVTSTWLADRYADDLSINPKMDVKTMKAMVRKDYMAQISRWKAYRARSIVNEKLEGSYQEQYSILRDYCEELKRSNPGSTIMLKTELEGEKVRFHRLYICFAALKTGFIEGCRPIVGLDGCHIKGPHPGQLLAAVGIDGNNGMYPIAYAIVEIENKSTWTWFLDLFKNDVGINNGLSWVFITDKQKGLIPFVETLFPSAEHRHCVRHLYNNFKVLHKGLELKQRLWAAARATTVPWFDVEMSSLQKLDDEAYKWLKKENAHYWSRSHFSEHPKCDILINNLCEAFNSAILDARDKPILTMLETLRMYMMLRMAKQREACDKWHGDIGPRIHTIVEKNKVESSKCIAHLAGQKMYQVVHMSGVQFAVDLAKHTCTCRGWNLTGIPCGHEIACICRRHEDPVKYIHSCYKKASWKRAYGPFIHPIANEELWEHTNFPPILPPVYHKQPGRPKKVRAREKDEKPAAPTGSKLSRSFHVKIKCSICGEHGHNKRKCDKRGGANNINKAKRPSASRGQPSTINKAKRPSASRGQPCTISERTIQPNLANTSTYQPSSSLPMESQPVSSVTTNTTRKFRLKSPAKKTKI